MISSDYNNLVGQFIKDQLETNLGVKVNVNFYDQGSTSTAFSGNYNATIQSWIADWPYPDNFLTCSTAAATPTSALTTTPTTTS